MTTTANKAMNKTENIVLSAINVNDTTYQVREFGINPDHVEALVFSNPETWEDIIVKQVEDKSYAIVSGFHRYEAMKQRIINEANKRYETEDERNNAISHAMQNTTIRAQVVPITLNRNETILHAYRYNSEHGLPLTTAEKKAYAVELFKLNPKMAHYKIAELVHISDKTVTSAIETYQADLAKANRETEDIPDEGVETEETNEGAEKVVDYDKVATSLINALRAFYVKTKDIVNEESIALLVKNATKKETNKQDSDFAIISFMNGLLTDTVEALTPKPTKKTKTTKTPKTTKEATETIETTA